MLRRALSLALIVAVAFTACPLVAQPKTATKAQPKVAPPKTETKKVETKTEAKVKAAPKAAVAAGPSPLIAIPGDAAIMLRIKGFQGLLKKVATLADAVQPGTGATVQFGGAAAGGLIQNPTLDGVDLEGEFFLSMFFAKDKAPGVVFIVPGKDLAAMKEALGDSVSFVEVGKHGVYSTDEELVNSIKEQMKSTKKDSLADAIDARSMAVLNRGDISVFVNVPSLLETYKDEFAMAQGFIENIGNAEQPPNAPPGMNWKAIMASVQSFVGKLVKAIEDHDGITISISLSDKDILIEKYFKLDDESDSGKALKGGSGSDMPLLSSLPAGSLGYYSLHCDLNSMAAELFEFSAGVIEDEKVKEALKVFVKEISTVKFNGAAGAINLNSNSDDGPGAFRMVNVINVSDPQKVRALTKKYSESMKVFEANNMKTEVTYKADAEKIGTTSIDHTISTITISDDAPDADKQKKIMKFMYGDGPVTSRTAFLKDKIVQSAGGGKGTMETALNSLESRSAVSAGLAATRGKLGAKPNFVGLLDIANFAIQAMKIAQQMEGNLPFDVDAVAEGLTLEPSYVGFAVEVEDAAVSLKTVVTVDQIKNIVKLGTKIAKTQAGN